MKEEDVKRLFCTEYLRNAGLGKGRCRPASAGEDPGPLLREHPDGDCIPQCNLSDKVLLPVR